MICAKAPPIGSATDLVSFPNGVSQPFLLRPWLYPMSKLKSKSPLNSNPNLSPEWRMKLPVDYSRDLALERNSSSGWLASELIRTPTPPAPNAISG